jgi:hypothetical protein
MPEDNYEKESDSDSLKEEKVEDPVFAGNRRHENASETDNRVLIWGILTQPLIGELKSEDGESTRYNEYVPAAHVKFIEQTGAKVVPVSYRLKRESLFKLL